MYLCTIQVGKRGDDMRSDKDYVDVDMFKNVRESLFCATTDGELGEIRMPMKLKDAGFAPNLRYAFRDHGHIMVMIQVSSLNVLIF